MSEALGTGKETDQEQGGERDDDTVGGEIWQDPVLGTQQGQAAQDEHHLVSLALEAGQLGQDVEVDHGHDEIEQEQGRELIGGPGGQLKGGCGVELFEGQAKQGQAKENIEEQEAATLIFLGQVVEQEEKIVPFVPIRKTAENVFSAQPLAQAGSDFMFRGRGMGTGHGGGLVMGKTARERDLVDLIPHLIRWRNGRIRGKGGAELDLDKRRG